MDGIERQRRSLGGAGILTDGDLIEFSTAARAIERLMRDGRWHTATEIIAKSGQREGLRRMRELRRKYHVERRASAPKSREWLYRLDLPVRPEQPSLFG